jgi:hypothetical protein
MRSPMKFAKYDTAWQLRLIMMCIGSALKSVVAKPRLAVGSCGVPSGDR